MSRTFSISNGSGDSWKVSVRCGSRKTLVYTSPILSVDFSQGVVETLNTTYRLGEPSDEYKSWFNKRRVTAA